MPLTFVLGHPLQPRGHALLFFERSDGPSTILATYVIVLPIRMNVGKYLPPLLASQLGALTEESLEDSLSSFAVPPVPEYVADVESLRRLALFRHDDLVDGGTIDGADLARCVQDTTSAAHAYAELYRLHLLERGELAGTAGVAVGGHGHGENDPAQVTRVLYELMTERDQLAELSRLVSTMRFALERDDVVLARETDASMAVLQDIAPERYWIDRIRRAAADLSDHSAHRAALYLDRCYKLLAQEYEAVADLEREIDRA